MAGTHERNINGGVEITGTDTNRGLAGLPCFLRDIFQGEVEVVLPTVLTVGSIGSNHVLPLGCVGQNNLVLSGLILLIVLRSFFLRVLGLRISRLRLLRLRILFLRCLSSCFCTRGSACRSTGVSARGRVSTCRRISARSLGRGLRGGRSRANRSYLNRSGRRVVVRAIHSAHKVTCVIGVVNLELRTRSASNDAVITQNLVADTTGILYSIPGQNVLIVLQLNLQVLRGSRRSHIAGLKARKTDGVLSTVNTQRTVNIATDPQGTLRIHERLPDTEAVVTLNRGGELWQHLTAVLIERSNQLDRVNHA